jgi:hypothetical protein
VYGHVQTSLSFFIEGDDRDRHMEQIKDFKKLAASPAFKACELRRCSYDAYYKMKGAVIFVDSPYKNSSKNETHYPILKHAPFCHDKFWLWFRKISVDNFVYRDFGL